MHVAITLFTSLVIPAFTAVVTTAVAPASFVVPVVDAARVAAAISATPAQRQQW